MKTRAKRKIKATTKMTRNKNKTQRNKRPRERNENERARAAEQTSEHINEVNNKGVSLFRLFFHRVCWLLLRFCYYCLFSFLLSLSASRNAIQSAYAVSFVCF